MSRRVSITEPVQDLRAAGIQMQELLRDTLARVKGIKDAALLLEANRVLDRSRYVFRTVSQTVQMVESTRRVLQDSFGLAPAELFDLLGIDKNTAAITTRGTVELVNNAVNLALNDLKRLNEAIDKETRK
jgi:hypothetical protein